MKAHVFWSASRVTVLKMPGGSQLNKSYFYAIDELYGYGNISYFTFFSEFNRSWEDGGHVEAGLMLSLFVLSITGNTVIIGFFIKSKQSRTITNYFVCNLAIADLLFSMSAPFVSYIRVTSQWRFGDGMCHFLNYEMFVCATVMIWTMTVISIDRYRCIHNGTSANKRLVPIHVAAICVAIWLVSICAYLPIAVFFRIKTIQLQNETICFCNLLWPGSNIRNSAIFTLLLTLLGFITPLSIIAVNYFRIFRIFWASKTAVASMRLQSIRQRKHTAKRLHDLKIVKTLVLLVVLFIVMWLPVFITFGLIQYDISVSANNISSSVLIWSLIVAYVNPCVNPFLYGFINKELYHTLMSCCRRNRIAVQESGSPLDGNALTTDVHATCYSHM